MWFDPKKFGILCLKSSFEYDPELDHKWNEFESLEEHPRIKQILVQSPNFLDHISKI
ncbi:MAG: hypothetical protein K0S33_1766 [Bacteroidetes bacterium]|jgi:hypothetical protein|nr:hypothetical protein [Bacteroidota bacterium]